MSDKSGRETGLIDGSITFLTLFFVWAYEIVWVGEYFGAPGYVAAILLGWFPAGIIGLVAGGFWPITLILAYFYWDRILAAFYYIREAVW